MPTQTITITVLHQIKSVQSFNSGRTNLQSRFLTQFIKSILSKLYNVLNGFLYKWPTGPEKGSKQIDHSLKNILKCMSFRWIRSIEKHCQQVVITQWKLNSFENWKQENSHETDHTFIHSMKPKQKYHYKNIQIGVIMVLPLKFEEIFSSKVFVFSSIFSITQAFPF